MSNGNQDLARQAHDAETAGRYSEAAKLYEQLDAERAELAAEVAAFMGALRRELGQMPYLPAAGGTADVRTLTAGIEQVARLGAYLRAETARIEQERAEYQQTRRDVEAVRRLFTLG